MDIIDNRWKPSHEGWFSSSENRASWDLGLINLYIAGIVEFEGEEYNPEIIEIYTEGELHDRTGLTIEEFRELPVRFSLSQSVGDQDDCWGVFDSMEDAKYFAEERMRKYAHELFNVLALSSIRSLSSGK